MKRIIAVLSVVLLFTGCGKSDKTLERVISLRNRLLQSSGCAFDAVVTADYGDKLYSFSLTCEADEMGNVAFKVIQPETISGITGTVSEQGGKLTFDDQVLGFEMLADGQVTPVSAPWLFLKTLRGGYLNASGVDGEYIKLSIDDSYEENPLYLDIWLDQTLNPVRGEILWQGRRIVSLEVSNFRFL